MALSIPNALIPGELNYIWIKRIEIDLNMVKSLLMIDKADFFSKKNKDLKKPFNQTGS